MPSTVHATRDNEKQVDFTSVEKKQIIHQLYADLFAYN